MAPRTHNFGYKLLWYTSRMPVRFKKFLEAIQVLINNNSFCFVFQ